MDTRSRASGQQFSALLEFMESHGDLTKPQPGAQGRLRAERLWQDLATNLNSIGSGVNRSPDKWKKVWADWKSKTKKKGLLIRRHASGGGSANRVGLTALETRLLGLIGVVAVEGHPVLKEYGIDRLPAPTVPPQSGELGLYEMVATSSPPLPELPSLPSTSQQQLPPPTPARLSPPRPAAVLPTPTPTTTPPPPQSPTRPPSSVTSPRRRRLLAVRRRRALTPFDRAASEFAAMEQRRLVLEEMRERNEARRIEVDEARNNILTRFADIAEACLQQHLQRGRGDRHE